MLRRAWHRNLILVGSVMISGVLACSPAAARPVFKENSLSTRGASTVIDISPDKEVVTVVASDLSTVLNTSARERESRREFTLEAGVSGASRGLRAHVLIDAHADTRPGVRATLLVRVNGSKRSFLIPVGAAGLTPLQVEFKLADTSRVKVTVELLLTRSSKSSRALGLLGVDLIEVTLRPL